MATRVLLVVPSGAVLPPLDGAEEVVRWSDLETLLAGLGRDPDAPCVLVSDGLHADTGPAVAGAIRARRAAVIEVRSARWDGESPSPVSAACRGVLSGFGLEGVIAAVALASGEVVPGV